MSTTQSLFITQGRAIRAQTLVKVNPLEVWVLSGKTIFAINYWIFSVNISLKFFIWEEKKKSIKFGFRQM